MNPENSSARQQARHLLLIVAGVILVEALAYVIFGIISAVDHGENDLGTSMGIGLFLVLYGLAQAYACRKVLSWRTWARGPLVFTQLVQLGLAWGLRDSDQKWLAVVMAVAALVALGCLFSRAVTRALTDEEVV